MAETPSSHLVFGQGCPDCAERTTDLPPPILEIGDDFDWATRDYDGFRIFMLQELAARFPERKRWTPADLEVMLIELLAASLDQLSDKLDRVASEAYISTARRPESVRRLLGLIGYEATDAVASPGKEESREVLEARLDEYWRSNPSAMDDARKAGPRGIRTQKRMVTVDDYATHLEDHPLVLQANSWFEWSGSWPVVHAAVLLDGLRMLDDVIAQDKKLTPAIDRFHAQHELPPVPWSTGKVTCRTILASYLDAYRLVGQEVLLHDAVPVPIIMSISVTIGDSFFQSEIRSDVAQALGRGLGGLFAPGNLKFGEDLHTSDVIRALSRIDGIESVCLSRFKKLGAEYVDASASQVVRLSGREVAVCNNESAYPENGFYSLKVHGGIKA